ncbi:MAG: CRISPR-associated protein Cas5 [Sulfurihydrogenibium sp.]
MIRLKIYQESAHFRIPTIGNPYLSYPLPPPSTVYGFLRAITGYESINSENTRLSIQGRFEGISFEKEQLILTTLEETKTNIIPIQKLHQCNWVIHIDSKFEDKIVSCITKSPKALRLGRKEDLIIDIQVDYVDKIEFNKDEHQCDEKNKIYKLWNWNQEKDIKGSLFRISLDTIVNEKKEIIGYKYVNLIYTSVFNLLKDSKTFDGQYIIEWLSG